MTTEATALIVLSNFKAIPKFPCIKFVPPVALLEESVFKSLSSSVPLDFLKLDEE